MRKRRINPLDVRSTQLENRSGGTRRLPALAAVAPFPVVTGIKADIEGALQAALTSATSGHPYNQIYLRADVARHVNDARRGRNAGLSFERALDGFVPGIGDRYTDLGGNCVDQAEHMLHSHLDGQGGVVLLEGDLLHDHAGMVQVFKEGSRRICYLNDPLIGARTISIPDDGEKHVVDAGRKDVYTGWIENDMLYLGDEPGAEHDDKPVYNYHLQAIQNPQERINLHKTLLRPEVAVVYRKDAQGNLIASVRAEPVEGIVTLKEWSPKKRDWSYRTVNLDDRHALSRLISQDVADQLAIHRTGLVDDLHFLGKSHDVMSEYAAFAEDLELRLTDPQSS